MNNLLTSVILLLSVACYLSAQFVCPPIPASQTCDGPTACLYPDPTNCSRFYQCDAAGNYWLKNCPPTVEWSSAVFRCEWPSDSDCGASNSSAAPLPPSPSSSPSPLSPSPPSASSSPIPEPSSSPSSSTPSSLTTPV